MARALVRLVLLLACFGTQAAAAQPLLPESTQLVFGSFRSADNASNWATRLSRRLKAEIDAEPFERDDGTWYRVVTAAVGPAELSRIERLAGAEQLAYWRLLGAEERLAHGGASVVAPRPATPGTPTRSVPPARPAESLRPRPSVAEAPAGEREPVTQMLDVDLGLQSRTFFQEGLDGQSKFHPSLNLTLDYYRSWDDGRQSFTAAPFFRYDVEDDDRTLFDLRELFWTRVGDSWDLHVGVKQVFWGVTEFNHLIDIVNQTDLVDNIDQETKLGQPMVHLSVLRDWGILDFHLLTGFRERTFPGEDGRPRWGIPIDTDGANYDSGAEDTRIDGVVRYSNTVGPLEFGIYHFSGTSRDPLFDLLLKDNGEPLVRPRYPVIDQTGFDGQAIVGDWAFKLEAFSRSGFGHDRYAAATGGFERTLVGFLGTRTDLGLIAEYLWDERDDDAFDTVFEHDIALGTRWALNDVADTTALLGIIWDHDTDETIVKLEASRRLGDTWTLLVEGRAFAGADEPDPDDSLEELLDPDNKLGQFVRDDYLQFEITRYF